MRKLLCANFVRLRKDKILWLMAAVCFFVALYDAVTGGFGSRWIPMDITAEYYMFNTLPMVGAYLAVAVSMFLGTEYADETIRNKLIVGHRRENVYRSNYCASLAGGLIIMASWLLGVGPALALQSIPLGVPIEEMCLHLVVIALAIAAMAAIYTFIGSLCTNKAYGAVIALVVSFILLVLSSVLYNRLCEVEIHPEYSMMTETGELQVIPAGENPNYLRGWARQVCLFLVRLLPTGQIMLFTDLFASKELGLTQPGLQLTLSAALILVLNLAGMWFFQRKNLK